MIGFNVIIKNHFCVWPVDVVLSIVLYKLIFIEIVH